MSKCMIKLASTLLKKILIWIEYLFSLIDLNLI